MLEIVENCFLFSGKPKRINQVRFRVFPAFVVLSALLFGGLFANDTRAESTLNSSDSVSKVRKAAYQGYVNAQFMLGEMYARGEGVPQDYGQAATWFRKAADQGDAAAQFILGMMYDGGNGLPQDHDQATAWYRKAANNGHALAQFNLSVMYYKGEGVPQDYGQAYMWVNLAATTGLEKAINSRNVLIEKMTPSQIEEGQRLTREWIAQHP
jgi:uncharacterized protein